MSLLQSRQSPLTHQRNSVIKTKKVNSKSPTKKSAKPKPVIQSEQQSETNIVIKDMMNTSTYDERAVGIEPRKILSRSYLSGSKNHDDSSYSICANIQLGLNDIPHILSHHYFRPSLKSKYKDRMSKFSLNEEIDLDQIIELTKDIQNEDIAEKGESAPAPLLNNQNACKIKRHPTAISRSNLGIINKRASWREVGKSLILPTIIKSSENITQDDVSDYEVWPHEGKKLSFSFQHRKAKNNALDDFALQLKIFVNHLKFEVTTWFWSNMFLCSVIV